MRPRPEGRGEPRHEASFNVNNSMLQCGHDPKAVENLWRRGCRPRRRPRFNAATTRRPWRTRGNAHATGRLDDGASMRPRPEGRGERRRRKGRQVFIARFNAATTRRPWRTPKARILSNRERQLQCGHDPKAVENPRRGRPRRGRPPASMRPRPEGRGEHTPPQNDSARNGPSMRPRPEGRGELPQPFQARACAPRAFNAATTRRSWRTRERAIRRTAATRGFNAATTRRPWRTR